MLGGGFGARAGGGAGRVHLLPACEVGGCTGGDGGDGGDSLDPQRDFGLHLVEQVTAL